MSISATSPSRKLIFAQKIAWGSLGGKDLYYQMDILDLPQLAPSSMVPWLIHLAGAVTKTINEHTPTDRLGQNPLFERHLIPLINQYLGPKPFTLAIPGVIDVGSWNGKLLACAKKDLYIFDPKTRSLDRQKIISNFEILLCARVRGDYLFYMTAEENPILRYENLIFDVIDLNTFRGFSSFRVGDLNAEMFEVHPNGKLIYFLTAETIQIRDLSGNLVAAIPLKQGEIAYIYPFCFDSEGNFLAPAIDQGDGTPQIIPVYQETKLIRELTMVPAYPYPEEDYGCLPVRVVDHKYIEHLQRSEEAELSIADHTGRVLRVLTSREGQDSTFDIIPGYAVIKRKKKTVFYRI